MRRLLITNLSHMRRSDCNLPLIFLVLQLIFPPAGRDLECFLCPQGRDMEENLLLFANHVSKLSNVPQLAGGIGIAIID